MSSYKNTCEVCGDTYITECWEPEKCPFCELTAKDARLTALLERWEGKVKELDGISERNVPNILGPASLGSSIGVQTCIAELRQVLKQ